MKTVKFYRIALPELIIGVFLLVTNIAPSIANEVKLQAFEANYSLYIKGLHVSKFKLSLTRSGNLWHWQTSNQPRGIYRLLSDKKPYSETTFSLVANRHLIQNIWLSDEGNKNPYETADFDWHSQQATILRKKISSTARLNSDVYDYHSINWLVANMMQAGKTEQTVDFYTKGEIIKSVVKRIENQTLETAGQSISAWVYEQSIALNKAKLKYYFNPAKPLLPLKIEKLKLDQKTAILVLKTATWH